MGSLKQLAPRYNTGYYLTSIASGLLGLLFNSCINTFLCILFCSVPFILFSAYACIRNGENNWQNLYRGIAYFSTNMFLLLSPLFVDCWWGLVFGIFGMIGSIIFLYRFYIVKKEEKEANYRQNFIRNSSVFSSLEYLSKSRKLFP
jgi:hypothetical protein